MKALERMLCFYGPQVAYSILFKSVFFKNVFFKNVFLKVYFSKAAENAWLLRPPSGRFPLTGFNRLLLLLKLHQGRLLFQKYIKLIKYKQN